jgi:plastocyanin domain-containing protein
VKNLFILLFIISSLGVFAKKFETPKRAVSVIISNEGLYPEKIVVFKGEEVQLFVTSVKDTESCLMIREDNFFVSAKKGIITEGAIRFERAGTYNMHCPSDKFKGDIVVLERASERKASRNIASEKVKKPQHWMPKEY